ncbi:L-aspartate oxidase [Microbacterium sp. STN6]|uniref:L-aspartate oxidase n=1 Tax=Microbacterium sp. STN6 TaxID=2995588 RepID=UPI002260F6AE|nr:L-aspartate oxidase [Microbacterium sp. STN6]MCX7521899.1 L-aspartate oxidase [Microbacterium sp. STN6]
MPGADARGDARSLIVVGSGIAGLVAALTASATHDVTLVTKGRLAESNTRYAQGGIAAALFDDDSVSEHMADTLRVGGGLNDRAAVEVLCTDGPLRVRELMRWGVAFDRDGRSLARGLEAAHSHARVLHAGGDATGAAIEDALVAAVRASAVRVVENAFLVDLEVDGGRVVGVELGLDTLAGARFSTTDRLYADAVILATGGAGHLYRHTTNPTVATGDGAAAAWRAGARLVDLEFYQFHPTALAVPGSFLVSEAVRGEGAVLRNARGERFMLEVHPDAELAPRDVVARGIAVEMAAQGGEPVLLDATELGGKFLSRRFPTIDAACRANGLDWAREPVPVTPAAHYWMGGVATDAWGRTSLPGLLAVGEVACTGVHGANRLASNSLLEGAVFAHRAATVGLSGLRSESSGLRSERSERLETPLSGLRSERSERLGTLRDASRGWVSRREQSSLLNPRRGERSERLETPLSGLRSERSERLETPRDASRGWVSRREQSSLPGPLLPEQSSLLKARGELQALMWRAAGVHRDGAALTEAAQRVAELGDAPAASAGLSVTELENRNLRQLAALVLDAALERRESRGAHFRSDYPTTSDEFARHFSRAREVSVPC